MQVFEEPLAAHDRVVRALFSDHQAFCPGTQRRLEERRDRLRDYKAAQSRGRQHHRAHLDDTIALKKQKE
jgi:hypothetical protein